MDSLRQELVQTRQNIELKNVDLDLKEYELSEKKEELIQLRDELTSTQIELMDKKEELMQMRDNFSSVQKTLSEKETLLQETNTRLAEQIPKTSSESEVFGGDKGLKKGNEITSPKSPYDLFFQHAFIIIIVLLIIYILWRILSHRYSSNPPYNEEKNIPNYKMPLNRNQSYG
ncbi:hypothetical protein RhiirC2_761415 [Rhizophagus irregularis]|uniref:Uncharacterized protein n=1 Tax=Rhizophagus irregularis TaxID=588596 RepID=A0A2N1MGP5_9GLOM|nr:hypothetical protein RhiirC2_763097 [Rhizophagus irregularis]PKK60827.1 hypothetical protein RhiirC2_761415 [Rhizophagus irregularis]